MRNPISTLTRLAGLIMLLAAQLPVFAEGLLSQDEFAKKREQDQVVVVEIQPLPYYQQAHIPGSVHTDYNHWRQTNAEGLGKMLPNPDQLADLIGGLGISNDSEVVIVPIGRGAGDMAAAARIYWTMYVAGLNQLSILEGGLLGYYQRVGREGLQSGYTEPVSSSFTVALREEQIMTQAKVADYLAMPDGVIDARSPEEYLGLVAGGPLERPGAMPGAVNLPYDSLMSADQSSLLDSEALREKYEAAGASLTSPQVSYCHTGHRTSLVWFVSHELLGNKQARLYDGSTLEWAVTKDRPLVVHGKQG